LDTPFDYEETGRLPSPSFSNAAAVSKLVVLLVAAAAGACNGGDGGGDRGVSPQLLDLTAEARELKNVPYGKKSTVAELRYNAGERLI